MTAREHIISFLSWTPWQPLEGCWTGNHLPDAPGIYRIRRVGHEYLDYIGETGDGSMTIKKRLGMLRDIYKDEMPYRAPHTAGPALWALRHSLGCEFEVSTVCIEGDGPWRKGLKCVAIGLHRERYGRSPTANFGRMPLGYRMSSGNDARLASTDVRYRGGADSRATNSHLPGIAPIGSLDGDVCSLNWCGHEWFPWVSIAQVGTLVSRDSKGLYRIREIRADKLFSVGQGRVQTRISAFQQPRGSNYVVSSAPFECSWVLNETWQSHQRLELENDLIAAHTLETSATPLAQFMKYLSRD